MKNKIIKTRYFLIILLFISLVPFCNHYFLNKLSANSEILVVHEDPVVWSLNNAPIRIDHQDHYFKQGLKVEKGVRILFKNNARLIIEGDFEVLGEMGHPVIFEGIMETGNFSISVNNATRTYINNAVFAKGGFFNCYANNYEKSFLKKVLANDNCQPEGALNIASSEELAINNTIFKENYRAINILQAQNALLTNNSFYRNKELAVYSEVENPAILKSNCWMRPSGPTYENNPQGRGEKIEGNFDINLPQQCGSEFKPIVLIPGIGGSWNWEVMMENEIAFDSWNFSPTFHGYDSWINSLEEQGYQKNRDYFVVYYDWRKDNHANVEKFLKPVLKKIEEISFDQKYDIIAHSMGGLVTLDYLTGDVYENNIDKVVLQGSPLLGASKAYPIWEGGLIPEDWSIMDYYLSFLSLKEENEGLDFYDLVHKYVPAVKQLLPLYNYIQKNDDEKMVNFWEMEEQNEYLMGLMGGIGMNKNNFDFEKNLLMIQGSSNGTSKVIKVDKYSGDNKDKLWKDGFPNPYPLEKEVFSGDGTVLNESSGDVPMFNTITIDDVSHIDLPAKAVEKNSSVFRD